MAMKKIIFLFLMFLLTFLVGCDSGSSGPFLKSSWTIIVWLDGDNNLEEAAMNDLNEMEAGLYYAKQADPNIEDKIKIIVQVDRAKGYDEYELYTGKNWTDTRRYLIKPDILGDDSRVRSKRLDDGLGEVNMGDASKLKEFVRYCKEQAPADKYALILWNHGSGIRGKGSHSAEGPLKGICQDETSNGDILYTGEITDVLTGAESVDFLGFDACIMGMLEVAYEYRPGPNKFGANAICFSPANEQGDGWAYDRLFRRFAANGNDPEGDACYDVNSLTAVQFAGAVAKEYEDFCEDYYNLDDQTQTAIDNSKIVNVKEKLDALAAKIARGSNYKSEVEALRGSEESTVTMDFFNEGDVAEWRNNPSFDLYDFAHRVSQAGITGTNVTFESNDLKSAIEECIIHSYGGSDYANFEPGKNGLAFFFTDGDRTDFIGRIMLQFQWWYTSVDTNSWWSGYHYYGKLDFCTGNGDGTVDGWFELMMTMYHDGDYENTHPGPAY